MSLICFHATRCRWIAQLERAALSHRAPINHVLWDTRIECSAAGLKVFSTAAHSQEQQHLSSKAETKTISILSHLRKCANTRACRSGSEWQGGAHMHSLSPLPWQRGTPHAKLIQIARLLMRDDVDRHSGAINNKNAPFYGRRFQHAPRRSGAESVRPTSGDFWSRWMTK